MPRILDLHPLYALAAIYCVALGLRGLWLGRRPWPGRASPREQGRRAKVYSVTAAVRRHLAEQREEWAAFSGALAAILSVT